jgi:hypothetical protein
VALALFAFFLTRVSQEQGSVEELSRELDSTERRQRIKEDAAVNELLKKSGRP